MTLLNSVLSFGALAFAIPLAIHLLFRNRFRTVDWGAMHLLEGVVRINQRRIQWLQLLLLVLRCLIPVLLAFCLARPVITGFRSLPGDRPQTLILAIDDSRSMSAIESAGTKRMDRALGAAQSMLRELNRNDEVMLIRSGQPGATAVITGPADASERLRHYVAGSGPVDLPQLIGRALEATADSSHLHRRIVLLSDFLSPDVEDSVIESLQSVRARFSLDPEQTKISFLNVGGRSESLENVFVESLGVDSPAAVSGREVRISGRIRNDSDSPKNSLRITWSANGQSFHSSEIAVDARSSATVRVEHSFNQRGTSELALSVEHQDAIVADNRRSIGVDVIDEVSVAIVNGQPSQQPLEGETDFLAMALSPYAFGNVDRADAIRTKVISLDQIATLIDEDSPNVLILANVQRPTDRVRRVIADYVSQGGSLILFDGGLVDVETYNQDWNGELGSWRLPAVLGETPNDPLTDQTRPIAIDIEPREYPAWQELGTSEESLFEGVSLYRHRQLSIRTANGPQGETPATSLLQTMSGDPLIVSASRGRGRIVQFAFPCDPDWSDFPLRPVFVPMMQQLVLELVGSQTQSTFELGRTISVAIAPWVAPNDSVAELRFSVQQPDDSNESLTPIKSSLGPSLVFRPVEAGVHIFNAMPIDSASGIEARSTIRLVEVSPAESMLQAADPKRIDGVAAAVEATVHSDATELQAEDQTRRYGREVWRWLLGLLLAAMVAELIVQQRIVSTGDPLGRRPAPKIRQVAS